MSAVLTQDSAPVDLEGDVVQPSITWMNMTGDVKIVWDDHNKEAILEYARKKMDEGYSFYILKPKKLFGIERSEVRHKVNAKNFDKVTQGSKGIVIPDEALNELIKSGLAQLEHKGEPTGQKREYDIERRLEKGEERELLKKESLAMKPLVGG